MINPKSKIQNPKLLKVLPGACLPKRQRRQGFRGGVKKGTFETTSLIVGPLFLRQKKMKFNY